MQRNAHGTAARRLPLILGFAIDAGSKTAIVNAPQCGFYLTQQTRLPVDVSNRQIPFRRILNLIHLIRALLDRDTIPIAQYPSQLRLFSYENLFDSAVSSGAIATTIPSARMGRQASSTGCSTTEPVGLSKTQPERDAKAALDCEICRPGRSCTSAAL